MPKRDAEFNTKSDLSRVLTGSSTPWNHGVLFFATKIILIPWKDDGTSSVQSGTEMKLELKRNKIEP